MFYACLGIHGFTAQIHHNLSWQKLRLYAKMSQTFLAPRQRVSCQDMLRWL